MWARLRLARKPKCGYGKAPRHQMLYEAAQELFGGKCKGALSAVVGAVLPAKADLSS
jgi:hypothetical protein